MDNKLHIVSNFGNSLDLALVNDIDEKYLLVINENGFVLDKTSIAKIKKLFCEV